MAFAVVVRPCSAYRRLATSVLSVLRGCGPTGLAVRCRSDRLAVSDLTTDWDRTKSGRCAQGLVGEGAHSRGSHSVESSFRSRISRTSGPIDRVDAFTSSWVTWYPRCCHQGSDFQATPSALRLVPAVTAVLPSALARISTDRTSIVPIPLP